MTGGQGAEVLVLERFRGEPLAHPARFHAATAAGAMGAGLELFARRKDGTEFPVEIGSSSIESPEGTLILSVIIDISARKQAEAQTRQHREEIAHLRLTNTNYFVYSAENAPSGGREVIGVGHCTVIENPTNMKTTSQFGLPDQIAELLLLLCSLTVSGGRAADAVAPTPEASAPEAIVSDARLSLLEARINDWGGV